MVDKIRWMSGQEVLIAGTVGGILKISSSSLSEPLTQTNISVRDQISIGVANIQPQLLTDSLVFVTGSGRSVRQLMFDELTQKWTAPDLTKIAKHITAGSNITTSGIVEMAFQAEPIPILWCVRADGQLLGFVYDNQEKIYAWFRVVTDGLFESVSVNKTDGAEDIVFVVVNRTIGGLPLRYIEYFMPHEFFGTLSDCFFVHSGLTTTLTNATQVTGLSHLALEEVDVMIAGVYIGRKTVSAGGVVTLGATYSGTCHVGLPYTSILEPMYLNVNSEGGTSQTKKQIISGIDVYFYQTGTGVEAGPDTSNLKDILLNELDINDDPEYQNELFTADVPFVFDGDWGPRASIVIQQADPLPMTVLEIVPRLTINEED